MAVNWFVVSLISVLLIFSTPAFGCSDADLRKLDVCQIYVGEITISTKEICKRLTTFHGRFAPPSNAQAKYYKECEASAMNIINEVMTHTKFTLIQNYQKSKKFRIQPRVFCQELFNIHDSCLTQWPKGMACLYLHGVGSKGFIDLTQDSKIKSLRYLSKTPDEFFGVPSEWTGDRGAVCDNIFHYTDTSSRGWHYGSLQKEYCDAIEKIKPAVVFTHSMGNLIVAAGIAAEWPGCTNINRMEMSDDIVSNVAVDITKGFATPYQNTNTHKNLVLWFGIQGPMTGSSATGRLEQECVRPSGFLINQIENTAKFCKDGAQRPRPGFLSLTPGFRGNIYDAYITKKDGSLFRPNNVIPSLWCPAEGKETALDISAFGATICKDNMNRIKLSVNTATLGAGASFNYEIFKGQNMVEKFDRMPGIASLVLSGSATEGLNVYNGVGVYIYATACDASGSCTRDPSAQTFYVFPENVNDVAPCGSAEVVATVYKFADFRCETLMNVAANKMSGDLCSIGSGPILDPFSQADAVMYGIGLLVFDKFMGNMESGTVNKVVNKAASAPKVDLATSHYTPQVWNYDFRSHNYVTPNDNNQNYAAASATAHGNDGMVPLSACMLRSATFTPTFSQKYSSPYYFANVNHMDGACSADAVAVANENAMPCAWQQIMIYRVRRLRGFPNPTTGPFLLQHEHQVVKSKHHHLKAKLHSKANHHSQRKSHTESEDTDDDRYKRKSRIESSEESDDEQEY